MNFQSDIDIDLGNRDSALAHLKHISASIQRDGKLVKHNSGVYFTEIPVDPFSGMSSLEYKSAESRGYVKLDLLNVSLYNQVESEEHLVELMETEPDWTMLYDQAMGAQLMHIGNHYGTLIQMPEAVNTIPRLAMFLAVIRPAKRHLIGLSWAEVAKTVWEKPTDESYYFKKAHAVSYAHLVAVHMNLLRNSANQSN